MLNERMPDHCMGYCDFENFDTPVGLLYDEFEEKALIACNDNIFRFNVAEQTVPSKSSKEAAPGREDCCVRWDKNKKLGGNIRNIRKSRYNRVKYDKQGSRAHVGRNYVAINRRNYPVIVTDVELDIVNTIYIKNEKEELEDIKSLDFVIRDDLNESVLLCGCKNKIYFTDIINHPRQAHLLKLKERDTSYDSRRQKGVISSLCIKTKGIGELAVFSSGTFSGSIFLHDLKSKNTQVEIADRSIKMNAITELYWLEDCHSDSNIDHHLISGDRRSDRLLVWDVRKPNKALLGIARENSGTDQKFSSCFDISCLPDENVRKLDIYSGDSRGNLNRYRLCYDYNSDTFRDETISLGKHKIDDRSVPFIQIDRMRNLLLTLSGERFQEHSRCTFKIWSLTSRGEPNEET